MKRFLAIAIIVFCSCSEQAKEAVVFKTTIKPNTTYVSEMSGHTLYETVFASEEAAPNAMDDRQLIESTVKMKAILVTENPLDNGNIPISIRYEDAELTDVINGKEHSTPLKIPDVAIKAFYTPDNKIVMDTIIELPLDKPNERTFSDIMESVGPEIDFPEKPMQVGDQFTTEKPMSIPSPAMKPMETNIKTTYTLNEIKAGKAYFTFKQEISLVSKEDTFSIEAKGSGTGSCEFDIDGQYLSYYKSELPLYVNMDMNDNKSSMVNLTTVSELKVSAE